MQAEPDTGSPPSVGVDAVVKHLQLFAASFPDGASEPQLTLVNGNHVVSVTLLRGTNTGPFPGRPGPTNKPIGFQMAHVVDLDAAGQIATEWIVYDHLTMVGQVQIVPVPTRPVIGEGVAEKTVVLARGDEAETKNLAAYAAEVAAFNAHDLATFGAGLADDLVWSELALQADQAKSEVGKRDRNWLFYNSAEVVQQLGG